MRGITAVAAWALAACGPGEARECTSGVAPTCPDTNLAPLDCSLPGWCCGEWVTRGGQLGPTDCRAVVDDPITQTSYMLVFSESIFRPDIGVRGMEWVTWPGQYDGAPEPTAETEEIYCAWVECIVE